jgi:apolipoprotein D and lipocalin family protein
MKKFTSALGLSLGLTIFLTILMIGSLALSQAADHEPTKVQPVSNVDLNQYMGTWYEMGSIPMFFQRMCVQNTQAKYALLKNGQVQVINQCQKKDGKLAKVEGRAKVVNASENSKLKVTFLNFFGYQFFASGDYWIIDLASDYRYAVVGHPSRKYGWILSRTQTLSPEDLSAIRHNLKNQNYDPCRFLMTPQQVPSEVKFSIPNPPKKLCELNIP